MKSTAVLLAAYWCNLVKGEVFKKKVCILVNNFERQKCCLKINKGFSFIYKNQKSNYLFKLKKN